MTMGKKRPPEPAYIDEVKRLVVESLEWKVECRPIEKAMGLALVIAEELYHDGAGENDALAVMRAAWRRCAEIHESGGCKGSA